MIVVDTSAMLALVDARERHHQAVAAALREAGPPFVVPAATLAEVAYLVERRLGSRAMDAVLADLATSAFLLDCGDTDLTRVRELATRYADLPLGTVDAAVIACAERLSAPVLTLDRRDFGVVGRDIALSVRP